MAFNLDNYEQVKDRITRFYSDHPDGRILTELVSDTNRLDAFAAFKALIYIGEILKSTGYAYESQGQGVNKDAWVENAETSAIGRGLANMDYCGTLRPSREEMAKVGNKHEASPIKDECAKLSSELGLTDSEKATMWKASGQNFSNLVILLRSKRDELNKAFDGIVEKSSELDKVMEAGK